MSPEHPFNPEDLLGFVELGPFHRLWRKLGLDDDDLLALQLTIMCDPTGAPVIKGTGGVRKLRFACRDDVRGKSASYRVCYRFFESHSLIVLALVYPKNQRETISNEQKQFLRRVMEEIEQELED